MEFFQAVPPEHLIFVFYLVGFIAVCKAAHYIFSFIAFIFCGLIAILEFIGKPLTRRR